VAADARQTDDGVARPVRLDFQKSSLIDDGLDHLVHQIGFGGIDRNDGVQAVVHAHRIVDRLDEGRVFHIV
jgi:hypothetical protein